MPPASATDASRRVGCACDGLAETVVRCCNKRTRGCIILVRRLTRIAMKRHILLALFRLMLAFGVVYAPPIANARWGVPYPGDGQQAFGFIMIFFVIGLAAAAVFIVLGSFGQVWLRRRPARFTLFTDLGLFLLFAGVLIYGGVSARYNDTHPNKSPEPTAVAPSSSSVAAHAASGRWLSFLR